MTILHLIRRIDPLKYISRARSEDIPLTRFEELASL